MKFKLPWGSYSKDSYHKVESDYTIGEAGCCDGWSSKRSEVDSVCNDCGMALENGYPVSGCGYSPVACKTCGWQPCDGSC